MRNILVLTGHPDSESFTHALASAYEASARASGARVERIDIASLDFDPSLRLPNQGGQPLEPDLVQAREAIERADHVAWFFPTWWSAPPAVVRGFVDRVFLPGWAYAYRKGRDLPEQLLRGRSARVVTTMDSPRFWYSLVNRRSVHSAFGTATLSFVGFSPVKATTFYELRKTKPKDREAALARVANEGEKDARKGPMRSLTGARLPS